MVADDSGLYFTGGNVIFDDVRYSQQSGANVFVAKLGLPSLDLPINEVSSIGVYPNPSVGNVNLNFGIATNSKIEIVNLLGQTVSRYECNGAHFNFDIDSGSGVYFIKITAEKETYTKKIIVE